jgi:hypothetical protein
MGEQELNNNNFDNIIDDSKLFRRKADKMIWQLVINYQKSMDLYHKDILELKTVQQEMLAELKKAIIPQVTKHEKIIYGDPEKPGEFGLISEQQRLKQDLKTGKWIFGSIWGMIVTTIASIIGFFLYGNKK